MKNILTFTILLGLVACSDSEYYKVQFDNVHHLDSGDKVYIKGLEVGEIKDMDLDDEKKILATIWVGRGIKLTKGSTFTIHADILRGKYVDINLGDSQEFLNPDQIHKGHIQPRDTTDFRKLSKEERDSLVKNDPIYRLADTVFHMLRKSRAKD